MNFDAMAERMLAIEYARGWPEYDRVLNLIYERASKHVYWEMRDAIRELRLEVYSRSLALAKKESNP